MRPRKLLSCLIGTLPSLAAVAAWACPLCATSTGQRVRAGIWDEHFWSNLLLTALPFAVFAAIIALLYFGVPFMRQAGDNSATDMRAGDHVIGTHGIVYSAELTTGHLCR